jgi:DNA-binding MarR family transcriptional regulator
VVAIVNVEQSSGAASDRQRRLQELNERTRALATHMRALRDPSEWSEIELTMPQIRALDVLSGAPMRMSEIAAALSTSMQATTSLIDRLVDRGLVERAHDPADRRVVLCRLTPAGVGEMERIYRIGQARFEVLLDLLTDEQLEIVIEAFDILNVAAIQRKQLDGAPSAHQADASIERVNTVS